MPARHSIEAVTLYQPGHRIGRLTVTGLPVRVKRRWAVPCRCDCGKDVSPLLYNLRRLNYVSCGCYHMEQMRAGRPRYGGKHTELYRRWTDMKTRCDNTKHSYFRHYGGRGISVCAEWRGSFGAFRDWALANGYTPGLSLERVNVNGGYEPANCTWIPLPEQANNRRNTAYATAFGETKTVRDWSQDPRCRTTYFGLYHRLKIGWQAEKAICSPPLVTRPRKASPSALPQAG